jgi:hypothetical protein
MAVLLLQEVTLRMKTRVTLKGAGKLLSLITTILLLAVTGCTLASPTTTATAPPAFAPGIEYTNAFVTEADDQANVTNVNFFVRTPVMGNTANISIIYYYDVDPPKTSGQPATTANGSSVTKPPAEQSVIWKNVPAGGHIFSAQLVNSKDLTPFNPPIIAQTAITVPAPGSKSPEIRIMSVQLGWPLAQTFPEVTQSPLPPLLIDVNTALHQFSMADDAIGKANVAGQGHLVYYLDVEPPTTANQTALTTTGTYAVTTDDFHTWAKVPAGRHVFSIQLVNNDNTPLNPPVLAQTSIVIPAMY